MSITKERYWATKSKPKHPAQKVMDAAVVIENCCEKPVYPKALPEKPKIKRFMADLRRAGLFRYAKAMAVNV